MKRNGYIVLLVAVLAWIVAAIVQRLSRPRPVRRERDPHGEQRVSPSCLPATLEHSASLPGTDVDVSPEPGTDTANPDTQISFLGTHVANIHEVSVVGSRSPATTPATLHGYSQGDGASFVPDKPFDPGERVVVRAAIGAGARRGRADRLRLSRRHPVSDGGVPRVPQPAGGARRLPELRHPARRPGADPDRHRARSRSRGGRHPHDQRARSGPVRAADLHAAGPARVVRQAVGRRNGGGPERADIRRPARPDVVEGARARRSASARAKTSS